MAQPSDREVSVRRRIVVVLDAGPSGRDALAAAAALAAAREAELLALFVEDADLLQVAGLPFVHEIGVATAARRALDALAMQRSMRAIAEEVRRTIELIARRVPLQWSFQVARGALDAETLAAAAAADLVIEALCGSERAARQLAELPQASARARLLRARTQRELEALKRELQRGR